MNNDQLGRQVLNGMKHTMEKSENIRRAALKDSEAALEAHRLSKLYAREFFDLGGQSAYMHICGMAIEERGRARALARRAGVLLKMLCQRSGC